MKRISIRNPGGFVLWAPLTQLETVVLAISITCIPMGNTAIIFVLFSNSIHPHQSLLLDLHCAPSTFLQSSRISRAQRRRLATLVCDLVSRDFRTEFHRVCVSCRHCDGFEDTSQPLYGGHRAPKGPLAAGYHGSDLWFCGVYSSVHLDLPIASL